MKLKFTIVSILFLLTVSTFQDSKSDMITSHKWFVKYVEFDNNKVPLPAEQSNSMWMIFHKDGAHEVNTGGVVKKGKWEFSAKKDSILFTTEKGTKKSMRLQTLSKTNLDMVFTEGGKEVKMFLE